jgi:NAD-dependent deacetylase
MPQDAMRRAAEWSEAAEIFVVVGSSLAVQPAASFPVVAKRGGALLAIVNREPTPLDDLADYNYRGAIGEFFTKLNPLLSDG